MKTNRTYEKMKKHRKVPVKRMVALLITCTIMLGVTGYIIIHDSPGSVISGMEGIETYRDIPGITESEIAAIEAIKESRQSFSFGKILSTEGFILQDGTYAGFSPKLCKLLSDLFGIPFVSQFYDWNSLKDGIDSGTVDFTSEYGITRERQNEYHMSDPIAQRSLSILTYGDFEIEDPHDLDGLRVGMFRSGIAVTQIVAAAYPELEFEIVPIPSLDAEAEMLRSGEIDAAIGISAGMIFEYSDSTDLTLINGLLPLAYTPVALTTAKDELEPVISVLNKYIAAGGINQLYKMYHEGHDEYIRNVLYNSFSDEEKAYIDNMTIGSQGTRSEPVAVPIVLGTDTYPVSFFNSNEDEFQGISKDVLTEISRLTGILFEPVNDIDASWGEILEMLKTGEAALISDLIITEERKEYFIWPETPFFSTPYAFFSKAEYPSLELYQIEQVTVGVVGWCATREIFEQWFPNSSNVELFDSQDDALDALENGEIDLFFNLGYILYYQQSYREKPGFKANYTFPVFNDTFFGLNKNEAVLSSIIDKTLAYIDTDKIANEWTGRSFDYSRVLAEEQSHYANQRTLIVSVSAAVLLLLMVVVVLLLLRNNKTRKMVMEAEQEAYDRFKIMLDTNPLCCKLWSSDYKLLDCNEAAIKLCGFQTKQGYLTGFFDLDPEFQPDGQRSVDKRKELLKRAFDEEGSFSFEWMHMLPDGSYMPAEITLVRVMYGTDYAVAGYTRDLREQKRMAKEIETALIKAQEASQAKSTFLANMSHEIRTPLNAVIGLSDLILNTDTSLSEESRYRLDRINNAGATLLNTVNDILDISKIESGKFELVSAVYDVTGMINDAVTQSILHIGEKPIEFVMNVCENLPTSLSGDELRIKQILNNFLSNAFKYTVEGFVELTIDCIRDNESVWLNFIIRDTGIGIKSEDMDSLFNDYVQVDMSANRKIIGTGLGLSISKRLIELMGGEIKVDSEYGMGSVFTVRLAQKYVTDDVISPEAVESLKSFSYSEQKRRQIGDMARLSLPYARVLIVDDVVTNLDVAKGLMKPYNMQIDCVTGGQEAIDAINDKSVRYNAIFMDHMMPGMDGIEATRRIREIGTDYARNIPIIALTANAIVGNEEVFLQNGFQAFISKPVEISHMDTVIREWVRDTEQEALYQSTDEQKHPDINTGKDWRTLHNGIPGINIEKGILNFNGDKDAYLEVLRSFAKNTPPLLEASKNVSKNSLKDYATIVHGIKGSSSSICAGETANMAKVLENAANAGDYEYVAAHNAKFADTVRRLISGIKKMIEEVDAANQKPKKKKPDAKLLEKLRQACENYEMSGVDEALDKLEAFDYETDGELIVWLRENAEKVNFDEIMEKLSA